MKPTIGVAAVLLLLACGKRARAQDPAFSQFYSSPLNINPGLTANINSDWRAIAHFRNQWSGPAKPYFTGTASFDTKIERKIANMPDQDNLWGVGASLMYDYAMAGAMKSTYGTLNVSYSMKLAEAGSIHRITLGVGTTYGRRYIDYQKLNFEEQFTGFGFDTNLPTGENNLSNMKPYFSLNTGIVYSIRNDQTTFDIGAAGYHLNQPKQSFLKDDQQVIPYRYVGHVSFQTLFNEQLMLSANAIYQFQRNANYASVGGALGYFLSNDAMVNAGLWYWSKNALVPYIGFGYNDFQVGFTYDITISKLKNASPRPNTFEATLILRGSRTPTKLIYCPWK